LTLTYQGRNAEYWGKRLYERDEWASDETQAGITAMKHEGLRFSLKALGSTDPDVRTMAARSLSHTAGEYESEFYPPLAAMLGGGAEERRWAAWAMMQCGFKKGREDIRKAADGLKKPEEGKAKADMLRYADQLAR
jgi:hypothetical protein